jgi:hypothetical protein
MCVGHHAHPLDAAGAAQRSQFLSNLRRRRNARAPIRRIGLTWPAFALCENITRFSAHNGQYLKADFVKYEGSRIPDAF